MKLCKTNSSLTTLMRRVELSGGQCYSSFKLCWKSQIYEWKFHDALYMCTRIGCASLILFITFTANPKWPETIEAILETSPTSTSTDMAAIIARVINLKLDELMHDLMHKQIFGRIAVIHMVIEYQKRMLPHAHMLVIVHHDDRHKAT
jgi:hypothetical protein